MNDKKPFLANIVRDVDNDILIELSVYGGVEGSCDERGWTSLRMECCAPSQKLRFQIHVGGVVHDLPIRSLAIGVERRFEKTARLNLPAFAEAIPEETEVVCAPNAHKCLMRIAALDPVIGEVKWCSNCGALWDGRDWRLPQGED